MNRETVDPNGIDWKHEIQKYDRVHSRITTIAEIINSKSAINVLDIGCAGGKLSQLLAPTTKYYGCDIVASELISPRVNDFQVWNVEMEPVTELKFDQKKFDVIVLSGVLEHVHDFKSIFEKVSSLLAKDGRVIVSYCMREFILYRMGMVFGSADIRWVKNLQPKENVVELFSKQKLLVSNEYVGIIGHYMKSSSFLYKWIKPFFNQIIFVFE